MEKLILWELHKKKICEYYDCSDSNDKQYPECEGMSPTRCALEGMQNLLFFLNHESTNPKPNLR